MVLHRRSWKESLPFITIASHLLFFASLFLRVAYFQCFGNQMTILTILFLFVGMSLSFCLNVTLDAVSSLRVSSKSHCYYARYILYIRMKFAKSSPLLRHLEFIPDAHIPLLRHSILRHSHKYFLVASQRLFFDSALSFKHKRVWSLIFKSLCEIMLPTALLS